MELALLVYVTGLILKVNIVLWVAFGIGVVIPAAGFISHVGGYPTNVPEAKRSFKRFFKCKTLLVLLVFAVGIPSENTMKYMGAAYLIQSTFESEFVQENVTLAQKAVIKQLQVWAEGDTDIQELLKSVDLPLPKKIIKEENN